MSVDYGKVAVFKRAGSYDSTKFVLSAYQGILLELPLNDPYDQTCTISLPVRFIGVTANWCHIGNATILKTECIIYQTQH